MALQGWAEHWGMRFNPNKCNILHAHRVDCHLPYQYDFCGCILKVVSNAKYLGVTISDNLEWHDQVSKVAKKANISLHFISRNLKHSPRKARGTVLVRHVRPPTVPSPTAAWNIVHQYGIAGYRRTRTPSRRSTDMEHAWSSTKPGATARWAPHNFWRSCCPLKPGITTNTCASCIRSNTVLLPCHPLNSWNHDATPEDIRTNTRLLVLLPTSTRILFIPRVYLSGTNFVVILLRPLLLTISGPGLSSHNYSQCTPPSSRWCDRLIF